MKKILSLTVLIAFLILPFQDANPGTKPVLRSAPIEHNWQINT